MNFKNLFAEERGVSPVIGVILMVAITVILAAVIGTFVLGMGSQLQDTSPQANFGFDTSTQTVATLDVTAVTITHETGDSISSNNLNILVNGQQAYTESSTTDNDVAPTFTSDVNAGSSVTIVAATNDADVDASTDVYMNESNSLAIDYGGTGGADVSDVAIGTGDTVRVVWSSDSGDSSATLGSFEIP